MPYLKKIFTISSTAAIALLIGFSVQAAEIPKVTDITPKEAVVGQSYLVMTVYGSNFNANSQIIFSSQGVPRNTTFISDVKLTTQVFASEMASAAEIGVSVLNPDLVNGDEISNEYQYFTVSEPGYLIIKKIANGGDANFDFSTFPTPTYLSLSSGNNYQSSAIALNPNYTYIISEGTTQDWNFTSAICDKEFQTYPNGESTVGGVRIFSGQTTTCTFTNEYTGQPTPAPNTSASLTIIGNGTENPMSFSYCEDNGGVFCTGPSNAVSIPNTGNGGSATVTIAAGSYNIKHLGQVTSIDCTKNGNSIGNNDPTQGQVTGVVISNGDSIICKFNLINNQNNNPPNPTNGTGSLKIIKNISNPNWIGNGLFTFYMGTGPISPAYSFIAPIFITQSNTGETVVDNVPVGNYWVYEEAFGGASTWEFMGANCSNGTTGGFAIVAGQTTTCTFTNKNLSQTPEIGGGLRIINNTINNGATFSYSYCQSAPGSSECTSSLNQISVDSNTPGGVPITNIQNGNYSLYENTPLPVGWEITSITCTNNAGQLVGTSGGSTSPGLMYNLAVADNDSITCTFNNTYTSTNSNSNGTGSLKIIKNTTGGSDTSFPFRYCVNFPGTPNCTGTLDAPWPPQLQTLTTSGGTGSITISGLNPTPVPGYSGKYSLGELTTPDWSLESMNCSLKDGTPTGSTDLDLAPLAIYDIEIFPNETTTCTFTNTYSSTPPPPSNPNTCMANPVSIYIIKGYNQNSPQAGTGVSLYAGSRYVNLSPTRIGSQFSYSSPDQLLIDEGQIQPFNQGGQRDLYAGNYVYPLTQAIVPRGNYLNIIYTQNEISGQNKACYFFTSSVDFTNTTVELPPNNSQLGPNQQTDASIFNNNSRAYDFHIFPIQP